MESEKVKEIKKIATSCVEKNKPHCEYCPKGDESDVVLTCRSLLKELLTLINELEECCQKWQKLCADEVALNKALRDKNKELETLCNKTYEDLTKEIDRLESELEKAQINNINCDTELQYKEKRIAELEDKIENGTIIELPCKVGEKVYMPWQYDGISDVATLTVKRLFVDDKCITTDLINDNSDFYKKYGFGVFMFDEIGAKVFLTKAEAEKKLEELKD